MGFFVFVWVVRFPFSLVVSLSARYRGAGGSLESSGKWVSNFPWVQITYSVSLFFVCFLLGPHPQHMEVPRLGVESELQLPASTTATATPEGALSATCPTAHGNTRSLTH